MRIKILLASLISAISLSGCANNELSPTIVTTIATCFIALLALLQWRESAKLVKNTSDFSINQLKAYVTIEASPSKIHANGIPNEISFKVSNLGQTPAYNLNFLMVASADDQDEGAPGIIPKNSLKITQSKESRSFIGPSTGIAYCIDIPINDGDVVKSILEGRWILYAHGEITYIDAFNQDRKTSFRFKLLLSTNNHLIIPGYWAICPNGNEMT